MPLLIDGHNLIGSGVFDDIHLSDEDDEAKLVARLRVWKSRYRGRMTVIFDHGITGGTSQSLSGGGVHVRFARNPQEADDLIRRRLQQQSGGLILVTNDAALQREALLHRVKVWRADEFVKRMAARRTEKRAAPQAEPGAEEQIHLSADEVAEWMNLFGAADESKPAGSRRSSGRPTRRSKSNRRADT